MKVKAAVAHAAGKPLSMETVELEGRIPSWVADEVVSHFPEE